MHARESFVLFIFFFSFFGAGCYSTDAIFAKYRLILWICCKGNVDIYIVTKFEKNVVERVDDFFFGKGSLKKNPSSCSSSF